MHMDRIGLISTNLAQKIALTVTELPYRVATDVISSTLARALVQEGLEHNTAFLGKRIDEEVAYAVKQMDAD